VKNKYETMTEHLKSKNTKVKIKNTKLKIVFISEIVVC